MNTAKSSDRAERYKRRNERRLREESAADLLSVVVTPLATEEIRPYSAVPDNVPVQEPPVPEPLREPASVLEPKREPASVLEPKREPAVVREFKREPLREPKQEHVHEPKPDPQPVPGHVPIEGAGIGGHLVYLSNAYLSYATVLPSADMDSLRWVPGAQAARNVEASLQLLEGLPECGDYALLCELLTEKVYRELGTSLPLHRCDICGNWFLTPNGRSNLHIILGLCVDPGHQCPTCNELYESAEALSNHECFFRSVEEAIAYILD